MGERITSRRSVLGLTGGLIGSALLGGAGVARTNSSATADSSAGPSLEWVERYLGTEEESQIDEVRTVFQTDGGGYALAAQGAPVRKSGAEKRQFALVRADESGEKQYVAFVDPPGGTGDYGDATTYQNHRTMGGVQTSDGGFVLVGYSEVRGDDKEYELKYIAHAAKFSSIGEVEWTRTIDTQREETETQGVYDHVARFSGVVATEDGGAIAAGAYRTPVQPGGAEQDAWLVKFTADGETAWERYQDEPRSFEWVETYGDGYVAIAEEAAVVTDSEGREQRTVQLALDEEQYDGHRVIATADGGFAYTGQQDKGHENRNFVLGRFDADGERQWTEEYDGPAGQTDQSVDLAQTEDGGFILTGYMSEAYSTDEVGALLKTDADGNEEWEKLLPGLREEYFSTGMERVVQTADGGYAALDQNEWLLAKLTPGTDTEDGGTSTPTPTESGPTPTASEPTDESGNDDADTGAEPTTGTEAGSDGSGDPADETTDGGAQEDCPDD